MPELDQEERRRGQQGTGGVSLRVLHLEDDLEDAETVRTTLAEEGLLCSIERVTERAEFLAALKRGGIDLILAEYHLPMLDGIGALAIAHELCREIPFIFVSGTLGEEVAIETLKSGATDYVIKRRMARLGPAVRRALDEVDRRAERVRLEGLLFRAQKMEIVGGLAGSVAHGFNDLLTVILGRGESLSRRLERDNPGHADCEEIMRAAVLAAALSRKLMAVSRQQVLDPKPVDLNETVREMEGMLTRQLGTDIQLIIHHDDKLASVKLDPGQWEQAIMNLAMNARDAMPHGGKLMVETGHLRLEDENAGPKGLPSGSYVTLSVSDTGHGMDAETRRRLFEPFFTTKGSGGGAGLGISAVQGIVEQSGGHIEVFSEVGRGTLIRILLPDLDGVDSRDSDATMLRPPQEADSSGAMARPTTATVNVPAAPISILLVEDEAMIRRMVSPALREAGYRVFEAANGDEALALSQQNSGTLTLLITDVVMPGMQGPELVRRLAPVQPGIKVIYMSGFADNGTFLQGLPPSGAEFIAKPFTPKALLDRVARVLEVAIPKAA